jgi:hypothetical protein
MEGILMQSYYVEVIFVGPQRSRGEQVFSVSAQEFATIRQNAMELEDDDARADVRALFSEVIARDPVKLAGGDQEAERARKRLLTLESR